jgi:hypothetical protein
MGMLPRIFPATGEPSPANIDELQRGLLCEIASGTSSQNSRKGKGFYVKPRLM